MARPGTGGGGRSGSSGRSSGGFSSGGHRSSGGRRPGASSSGKRPMGSSSRPTGSSGSSGSRPKPSGGYSSGGGYRQGSSHRGHHHNRGPRPIIFWGSSRRRRYREPYYGGGYRRRSSGGCLTSVLVIVMFLFILGMLGSLGSSNSFRSSNNNSYNNEVTSTTNREALPSGSVTMTDFYHDELDYIESKTTLLKGMQSFYNKTGVQPYLAFVSPVSETNTESECNEYANKLYDELFVDEGHLLLVYVEDLDPNEIGYIAYVCGSAARNVVDDEAIDILYSNIDKYWFDENLSTAQVFSNAFSDTATTIMKHHTNKNDVFKVVAIAIAVILILIILVNWWKARKAQKNKEQEDLERTLKVPLDKFGDQNFEDLKRKYEDE